ncbi:hypothetical protein P280DRAFT_248653 [Massarina eburnea CBS 473.64]|uniref:Uncharacterized protein n=1 Tax=Massarina eburnea CBS 473.64 TaxID=1395130 RepID=A0A6A6S6S3_9PLEO|nr:hypothetical protein P280DRAFT_248653 [Massarina eburnea CBS 473.64]
MSPRCTLFHHSSTTRLPFKQTYNYHCHCHSNPHPVHSTINTSLPRPRHYYRPRLSLLSTTGPSPLHSTPLLHSRLHTASMAIVTCRACRLLRIVIVALPSSSSLTRCSPPTLQQGVSTALQLTCGANPCKPSHRHGLPPLPPFSDSPLGRFSLISDTRWFGWTESANSFFLTLSCSA